MIKCKNLYGDIEINSSGDFIRTVNHNGHKKKEGIYSPLTQNQRHLELMKKIRMDRKKNFFRRLMLDSSFESFYKSIVVLSNPRTVLYDRYARKEVKDRVIRADQLIDYIWKQCSQSKELESSDKELFARANSYLELHKPKERDYTDIWIETLYRL